MIDTSIPEHEELVDDSRSRKRQERKRVQAGLDELVKRLVSLRPAARAALSLDDELRKALESLAEMKRGSALARQRRHVARLLRDQDVDAISKQVDAALGVPGTRGRDQRIDRWRDRLIEGGDPVFQELLESQPDLDRQRVRQAMRAAIAERERGERRREARALRALLDSLLD